MGRTTKINDRPEGSICEQFGYLPNSGVYLNSSGMNELYAIGFRRSLTQKIYYLQKLIKDYDSKTLWI